MVVPMLNDEEFAELRKLYSECMRNTSGHTTELGIAGMFRPLIEKHEAMTGVQETNHNAIIHHELALYGSPCKRCGKLLRTPTTSKCFECGEPNELGR